MSLVCIAGPSVNSHQITMPFTESLAVARVAATACICARLELLHAAADALLYDCPTLQTRGTTVAGTVADGPGVTNALATLATTSAMPIFWSVPAWKAIPKRAVGQGNTACRCREPGRRHGGAEAGNGRTRFGIRAWTVRRCGMNALAPDRDRCDGSWQPAQAPRLAPLYRFLSRCTRSEGTVSLAQITCAAGPEREGVRRRVHAPPLHRAWLGTSSSTYFTTDGSAGRSSIAPVASSPRCTSGLGCRRSLGVAAASLGHKTLVTSLPTDGLLQQ